jgi:hypothetical protein
MSAGSADILRSSLYSSDRDWQIDLAQIRFDRCPIHDLAGDPAGLAHPGSGAGSVRRGHRLIGEPRIRDKAACPGRTQDVAAPQSINAENGVCDESGCLVH